VLDEPVSLQAYERERENFHAFIEQLLEIQDHDDIKKAARVLGKYEDTIYDTILENKPSNIVGRPGTLQGSERVRLQKATLLFQSLHIQSQEIYQALSSHIDQEVNTLPQLAKSVQNHLLLQSLVFLLISLFLIIVFIRMIIAPIRQIDHAIRGLGMGKLSQPIKVRGSLDLEYLGLQLEWLRNRLNDLEESKKKFMHNVSHAIKSPLATLREGVYMLADQIIGPLNPDQIEITNILTNTTHKVEDLIEALINYDQANTQRQDVSMESLDIAPLIRDLLEEYKIQLHTKQINLYTKLESIKIVSNHDKLYTIIDNLLSNAIKFSPQGGDITITLLNIAGQAVLEVEDSGQGIEPDERKRIFEPFFQGCAANNSGVQGTGLGLAILNECVTSLHGKVEALEPHSLGARIRVQLPLD